MTGSLRNTTPSIDANAGLQTDNSLCFEKRGITPNLSFSTPDSFVACGMVKAGLGWSIVPEICLSYFDGIAEPLFFADGTPLTRSTYLLYRRRETELPQVRAFIQTVCERENIPSPVPRV